MVIKKLKIILFFLVLSTVIFVHPASALVYNTYSPTPVDLYDLDHSRYYTWGLNLNLDPNETVVGAELLIKGINNWDTNENILYVHLLESSPVGVRGYYDGQGGGDNLAPLSGILLGTYIDENGGWGWNKREDFKLTFDMAQINVLNQYLLDGNFGLGFDPDCHYYNKGIYLTLETATRTVPEPATMGLLFSGLLAAAGLRKKKLS